MAYKQPTYMVHIHPDAFVDHVKLKLAYGSTSSPTNQNLLDL
jgi:hypothetical protein